MQERRRVLRTQVLKEAKLLIGANSVIDCVVCDLTNVGAGVEVPNTMNLPEALDLTLDGGRTIRRSRCVWRKLNKTGVEFM
jgi:hypothetical protein